MIARLRLGGQGEAVVTVETGEAELASREVGAGDNQAPSVDPFGYEGMMP